MRDIDPDVWVNQVLYQTKGKEFCIIDDIRYQNELDALIGDDNNKSKDNPLSYEQDIISTQDDELIQNIEDKQVDVPVQAPINTPIKKVESEVTFSPSQTLKKRKHKSRNNKLAGLINLEDPIKTGIVFKEIFDKPKSLRRYKK